MLIAGRRTLLIVGRGTLLIVWRRPLLILLIGRALLILLLIGRPLLVLLLIGRALVLAALHVTLVHLRAPFAHLLVVLVLLVGRQNAHELALQLAISVAIGRASLWMGLRELVDEAGDSLLLIS